MKAFVKKDKRKMKPFGLRAFKGGYDCDDSWQSVANKTAERMRVKKEVEDGVQEFKRRREEHRFLLLNNDKGAIKWTN